MTSVPTIRVIGKRSNPRHPWLLWKQVEKPAQRLAPGSVVEFHTEHGFLGRGFYNSRARVSGRILTFEEATPLDAAFVETQINTAIKKREELGLPSQTDAWRVVNAEGDGLSGLVIDKYAGLLVVQYFSHGMLRLRDTIKKALEAHFPGSQFYAFAERHVQKQESFDLRTPPNPGSFAVNENGVRFEVSPDSQHKTGFFLDQRDNRKEFWARSCGHQVLDLCSHTGAFSVGAMKQGALSAVAIDRDPALAAVIQRQAEMNGVSVTALTADVSCPVAELQGKTFGAVVLDPPKQTRQQTGIHYAIQNYARMNLHAMKKVAPGGLLLTCSCTGWVKEEAFLEAVRSAAQQANRAYDIEKVTSAGPDHPWSPDFPEGRYLKAAWVTLR